MFRWTVQAGSPGMGRRKDVRKTRLQQVNGQTLVRTIGPRAPDESFRRVFRDKVGSQVGDNPAR